MKKTWKQWMAMPVLLMSFFVGATMVGCSDDDDPVAPEEPGQTEAAQIKLGATEVSIAGEGGPGEMTYNLVNAAANGKISAKVEDGVDWIHDFNTSVNRLITFEVDANDVEEEREATVTVTYSAEGMSDATATFKVVQGAKAPGAFDMTILETGSTWASFTLFPKDESMGYMLSIMDAETMDGYVSDEAIFNDDMAYYKDLAAMMGVSLSDILPYLLMTGSIPEEYGMAFINLEPSTEYCGFVYGVSADATLATPITKARFSTIEAGPVNNKIEITMKNVTAYTATFDIATETMDNYICIYGTKDLIDSYDDASLEAALLDPSTQWTTYAGPQQDIVYDGLTPNTEYTIVTMGEAGGIATTAITRTDFKTAEAVVADVTFSLDYKYFEGADVQHYFSLTGYEDTPFFVGKAQTDGAGYYWMMAPKAAFDQISTDFTDGEYIELLLANDAATESPSAYNSDYDVISRIVGVAYDENGNYGEVYVEDITLTRDGVAPASEFESYWGLSRAINTQLAVREFTTEQLQRMNIENNQFKQAKMTVNQLKSKGNVVLNVRSMVKK